MKNSGSKCENCNASIINIYGSGRFCSQKCARCFSTKSKRQEINEKVSLTQKKNYECDERRKVILDNARLASAKVLKERRLNRNVKIKGVEINITNRELDSYRKKHKVCEICGREERACTSSKTNKTNKLSVDHDHKNNTFRGLLCMQCNIGLGWLEKFEKEVSEYLNK